MVGRERITYATLTSVIDLSFSDAAAGSSRVSDAVAATAAADATAPALAQASPADAASSA